MTVRNATRRVASHRFSSAAPQPTRHARTVLCVRGGRPGRSTFATVSSSASWSDSRARVWTGRQRFGQLRAGRLSEWPRPERSAGALLDGCGRDEFAVREQLVWAFVEEPDDLVRAACAPDASAHEVVDDRVVVGAGGEQSADHVRGERRVRRHDRTHTRSGDPESPSEEGTAGLRCAPECAQPRPRERRVPRCAAPRLGGGQTDRTSALAFRSGWGCRRRFCHEPISRRSVCPDEAMRAPTVGAVDVPG